MSFLNNFNKLRLVKSNLNFFSFFKPKKLIIGFNNSGGRNRSGKITCFYRGGGHRRRYRFIDFYRDSIFFWNISALVMSINYDPNRNSYIALIFYSNGFFSYILATQNIKIGKIVFTGCFLDYDEGDRLPNSFLEFGTKINNIKYWSRAAGCYSKYLGPQGDYYSIISLPSGMKKLVDRECLVTVGVIGNNFYRNWKKYKAGQSRWLAIRPHVRGVAKNPIDHPMGGGQGKTSGGRVSVTPWGIYTKGFKTKKKKYQKKKKSSLTV